MTKLRIRFSEMFGIGTRSSQAACNGAGERSWSQLTNSARGFLSALTQQTPDDLFCEIARTGSLTDKPFGVNQTMPIYPEARRTLSRC
jgi:NADH:quinone reductase (non-electrogenic)